MLRYALLFFILAIIAAALGFSGIAGTAAMIAKVLLLFFLLALAVSVILHWRSGPPV
ncbi:Protein of unknown function [Solimonas aquatica]|uniref:UPF0391 membrane protein SAMN04488038_101379 n=1 Tax=Solimonas aquatica TaxID=489703 RepID=A0A1H9AEU8_9GAMM|nr:DUF1328 domain-containing protein [Solimonas aquatica]SEP75189.1 Protein of unknown function [Solimonas aquatica]